MESCFLVFVREALAELGCGSPRAQRPARNARAGRGGRLRRRALFLALALALAGELQRECSFSSAALGADAQGSLAVDHA